MLKEAENSIKKNDFEDVLEKTASSFEVLISEYEKKAEDDYKSPFYFGESLSLHNSFFIGFNGSDQPDEFRKLVEFIDKIGQSIEQMQFAIKIISLGIDYRKYVQFKYLTPNATIMGNGDIICEIMQTSLKGFYPEEELQFLVDFVIESSLKLQEFEIDYEKLNFKKPRITVYK